MNTVPVSRHTAAKFLVGIAVLCTAATTTTSGGSTVLSTSIVAHSEDPPTWDVYLLFLLRLLYELYGGDDGDMGPNVGPLAAMAMIEDRYIAFGTPSFSTMERADARSLIEDCRKCIESGPYAMEPEYREFVATLEEMDADLH
jgi:hypothetical protein